VQELSCWRRTGCQPWGLVFLARRQLWRQAGGRNAVTGPHIVLTGAAGFIGAHVVRGLLSRGARVTGLDNLSLRQPAPLAGPGFRFIEGDVRDPAPLAAATREGDVSVIVHLAAIHHIPTCEAQPSQALDVNVVGTERVLEAARSAGVGRVVLASSGAVYDHSTRPLEEDAPLLAHDVYALSKLTNERQLALWQGRVGGTAVVARIFNTIGPGDRNGHLIPELLEQLARGGSGDDVVVWVGNTAPKRDYVFVEDTADAIVRMAVTPLPTGQHFLNVGSGQEAGVLDVARLLARICGVTARFEVDPARVRQVDRARQLADIRRIRALLAWAPSLDLEGALRRIVAATR
jgi:UDP-glucose 4-epimerase